MNEAEPVPPSGDPATVTRAELAEIRTLLTEILNRLDHPATVPAATRTTLSVDEVARELGVSKYTVRLWCRDGRIVASKRAQKRGSAELWEIPVCEIAHHRDHGLRPVAPARNGGPGISPFTIGSRRTAG